MHLYGKQTKINPVCWRTAWTGREASAGVWELTAGGRGEAEEVTALLLCRCSASSPLFYYCNISPDLMHARVAALTLIILFLLSISCFYFFLSLSLCFAIPSVSVAVSQVSVKKMFYNHGDNSFWSPLVLA